MRFNLIYFILFILFISCSPIIDNSCHCCTEDSSLKRVAFELSGDTIISYIKIKDNGIVEFQEKNNQDSIARIYGIENGVLLYTYIHDKVENSGEQITYNKNGTIWSRILYDRKIPYGDVYCTDEYGDTVQYYYHSLIHDGEIVFSCLLDTSEHSFICHGNPIYEIGISSQEVYIGDSVRISVKYCNPYWALKKYELYENVNSNYVHPSILLSNDDFYNLLYQVVPTRTGGVEYLFRYSLKEKQSGREHIYERPIKIRVLPRSSSDSSVRGRL